MIQAIGAMSVEREVQAREESQSAQIYPFKVTSVQCTAK